MNRFGFGPLEGMKITRHLRCKPGSIICLYRLPQSGTVWKRRNIMGRGFTFLSVLIPMLWVFPLSSFPQPIGRPWYRQENSRRGKNDCRNILHLPSDVAAR
jgi:hypothetical protein